jgi:hypothetical protein
MLEVMLYTYNKRERHDDDKYGIITEVLNTDPVARIQPLEP